MLTATSGDTGSAAISGLASCSRAEIVVLYPEGRVSEVQRRQMTTVERANVHAVAVDGTFDDCQRIVKQLFGDAALRERVGLAAANSINWARVAAQVPYYVWATAALGGRGSHSPCPRATSATCSRAGSPARSACRWSAS